MPPLRTSPETDPAVEPRSAGSRWSWVPGVVLLVGFSVFVVLRFGEEEEFARMLRRAEPLWLVAAAVLQLGTYLCAAGIWRAVVDRTGTKVPLLRTAGLSVMKLSFDQIIPTAGVGGSVVVMRGLRREGARPEVATAALLVDMIAFYASHAVAVVVALVILWRHSGLHEAVLWLAAAFAALAAAVPCFILWATRRGGWTPPTWARRIPGLSSLLEDISRVPPGLVRDARVLVAASLYHFGIFLCDAATLSCMLRAVGQSAGFGGVFAAFMLATLVMTLSIIPGGVGTFEATAVGTMTTLGIPVEQALTAVLLLRGFTLWLPLPLGVLLLHRQLGMRLKDLRHSTSAPVTTPSSDSG